MNNLKRELIEIHICDVTIKPGKINAMIDTIKYINEKHSEKYDDISLQPFNINTNGTTDYHVNGKRYENNEEYDKRLAEYKLVEGYSFKKDHEQFIEILKRRGWGKESLTGSCLDCQNHEVIADPDPYDSFCMNDEAIVCKKMKNDKRDKTSPHASRRSEFKAITAFCSPFNTEKESKIPKWCPLGLGEDEE